MRAERGDYWGSENWPPASTFGSPWNESTQSQLGSPLGPIDHRFASLNHLPLAREAFEREGFESTIRDLDRLIADARGTELADKAFVAKFAMTRLYHKELKPRLGGSFAAYLRGGQRAPNDVDIEMSSHDALDGAYYDLAGKSFDFEGEVLSVRRDRDFNEGIGALLKVKLESSGAQINIDLVNENARRFNRTLVAPAITGSPAVGTTDTFRLIVNIIDRRLKKPRMSTLKQDAESVARLLQEKGYHPSDPEHWRAIREHVAAKLRYSDDVDEYMDALDDMLREYSRSQSGTHRAAAGSTSNLSTTNLNTTAGRHVPPAPTWNTARRQRRASDAAVHFRQPQPMPQLGPVYYQHHQRQEPNVVVLPPHHGLPQVPLVRLPQVPPVIVTPGYRGMPYTPVMPVPAFVEPPRHRRRRSDSFFGRLLDRFRF